MGNRKKYYRVTKEGSQFEDVNPQPRSGGEKGKESFEHRFGVRVATTHYDQLGYDVKMYHDPHASEDDEDDDDGTNDLFDVYALDTMDSPDPHRKLIEVETSPKKGGHVAKDFDKLANEYGDAIWVVEKFDDAVTLVRVLTQKGRLPEDIDRGVRTFEELNEQLDEDGMCKIIGMTDLMDKI